MKKKIKYSMNSDGELDTIMLDMTISKKFSQELVIYEYIRSLADDKNKMEFNFTCLKKYDDYVKILRPLLNNSKIGEMEGPINIWIKTKRSKELKGSLNLSLYKIRATTNIR